MNKPQMKRHEERYTDLCKEMGGWLNGSQRALALEIEENVKSRAAFYLLEEIRALQMTGFDGERIVEALIQKAESRLKPARDIEAAEVSI